MSILANMKPGSVGRIRGFNIRNSLYRQRLLMMGLTPGTCFTVVRRAPLGDPIQIRIRDYFLSLRQSEARLIDIELLLEPTSVEENPAS